MKSLTILVIFLTITVWFVGCQSNTKPETSQQSQTRDSTIIDTGKIVVKNNNATAGIISIYYDVPSPLEMSTILKRANAEFHPEILSPLLDIERFATEAEIALNLGVYGVDFGYCKILDQQQDAIKYLNVVRLLSKKLGIPNDRTKLAFDLFEQNKKGHEALLEVINETFISTDQYLKENKRETAAAMVFMGGWIEGLYLATNIYKLAGNNGDILNRIAEQKYSLNTMLSLISRYQSDIAIDKYYSKLLLLRKIYEKVEISYKKNAVKIDTSQKVITLKSESEIVITKSQIADITSIVRYIRNGIVN
jgi:hypothetical protein